MNRTRSAPDLRIGIITTLLHRGGIRGGAERATLQIMDNIHDDDITMISITEEERELDIDLNVVESVVLKRSDFLPRKVYQHLWKFPRELEELNLDVIFNPASYTPPFFWMCDVERKVQAVHGTSRQEVYHSRPLGERIQFKILSRIDGIVTPSNSSKRDIVMNWAISPEKISVIPWGVGRKFSPKGEKEVRKARKKYSLPETYVFHLSHMYPGKNVERIFKAAELAGVNLVVKSIPERIRRRIGRDFDEEFFTRNVFEIGPIYDDDVLAAIYSGAELFLFPSLYESFGFPILEAMACGTPVITSDRYSMPEVGGDAAYLVNPENAKEIAEGIERILKEGELREMLIEKGLERSKKYKPEKVGREYAELFRNVAK